MAYSIIRVELHQNEDRVPHDISAQCYKALHELMASAGYNRSYSTTTKKTFELPPAEYIKYGDESADQMRDTVAAIARRIVGSDRLFTIIVTRVADFASHNLKQL
ncbi:hypothetical protein NE850_39110 [Paraburkholderia sp. USG1]|uniref:hypothetical protein n=1 Tax=Paraburkholderia sp. USG1 TaxID=2952268 RepID=UPI00285994C8|nr:hypothetical protein [Paraburkholderia sp. USG1]MDR8402325.1 hypothetical protein [Paraburkholderia sp. USG1]